MSKFSTLVKLAKKGQVEKLQEILEQEKININELDSKSGQALIHIAIQQQDQDLINMLAGRPGIDLQLCSKQGETPLDIGVRLNNSWVVNRLLDRNVNFKYKNQEGQTVLHTALKGQTHRDILKKLTSRFDINEPIEKYGSYFNLAISAGHTQNVMFLLKEQPVDYSRKFDNQGNTCLLLAVRKNKGDFVVAILDKLREDPLLTNLDKQFFINHQNNNGNTALHEAVSKNFQTVALKLLQTIKEFGIDITLKNKKGQTVEDIRKKQQEERENQAELQKKKQEERVVKRHEKKEEKQRQRQQQEKERIEQSKRRKEEERRMKVEAKVVAQTQKKKTAWVIFILALIILAGMYLAFANAIEKKKPVTL